MPYFFVPIGSRDGYEQIGTVAPDSVGLVRMIEGTILKVGLRDAAGSDISSSVESIATNVPRLETPGPNSSRMLRVTATNAGACQLIAKVNGVQLVALDVVVEAAPKSKLSSSLTLSPLGMMSMSDARNWISTVNDNIKQINDNPVGKIVLKNIPNIVIIPDLQDRTCNASSFTRAVPTTSDGSSGMRRTIQFSPSLCRGAGAGDRPDEVLLHELIHQLEDNYGEYKNIPDQANPPQFNLDFDQSDFMTITITNLYASVNHRPLRKEHGSFAVMPQPYSSNEAKFFNDFKGNFVSFNRRRTALYRELIFVDAPWDPFQEIRP